jgi:hypothetical protein
LVAGVTMSEGLVLVERAVSGQVGAGGFELDAEAFHQALDGDFFLESLDLVVRYARHEKNLLKRGTA